MGGRGYPGPTFAKLSKSIKFSFVVGGGGGGGGYHEPTFAKLPNLLRFHIQGVGSCQLNTEVYHLTNFIQGGGGGGGGGGGLGSVPGCIL